MIITNQIQIVYSKDVGYAITDVFLHINFCIIENAFVTFLYAPYTIIPSIYVSIID